MKQFLKQIYQEGKVEKLEDKEEEKGWFTTLYDYLWGDDSDEEEQEEQEEQEQEVQEQEVDESKLYNEVESSNNEKIEKTLRE